MGCIARLRDKAQSVFIAAQLVAALARLGDEIVELG